MSESEPCYSVHHELALKTYHSATSDWANVSSSDTRCETCWLRSYNCFCDYFNTRRETNEIISGVNIIIYYHFSELGRSANTMHLFPALFPSNCSTVIFGDVTAESNLIKMIVEEQIQAQLIEHYGSPCGMSVNTRTCILYPTSDSVMLPKWMGEQNLTDRISSEENSFSQIAAPDDGLMINLVVLDGTYSLFPSCKTGR